MIGAIDARDEPAMAGTPRKDGYLARLAFQTPGFIPARGSVTENLQGLRRKRFKKFRLVGVMNNPGSENQRCGELVRRSRGADKFLLRTGNGREVHRPDGVARRSEERIQLRRFFGVMRIKHI